MARVANSNFDPDNNVTLTIVADVLSYTLGSNKSAKVLVEDNSTPTGISVIALEDSITEDDPDNPNADFQIKSNVVDSSARIINIRILQRNINYLSNTTLGMNTVTIPANQRYVNLPLTIESDSVFEIHGQIEVRVLPMNGSSATYSLANSNTSATIAVADNDFPSDDEDDSVSILAEKMTVSETDIVASFQIIAKTKMSNSRVIRVMASNKGSHDFLNLFHFDLPPFPAQFNSATISPNQITARYSAALDDDNRYEETGAIIVTILAEDLTGGGARTYSLSSIFSAEVEVTSEDPDLPIISISSLAAGGTGTGVTEGLSFNFTVTSDRTITGSPLEIQFIPSFVGGTTNPNPVVTGSTVSIPVSKTSATGTVTMDSDFDIGNTDEVKIEIEILQNLLLYYRKEGENSILVDVKDNDAPSSSVPRISISSTSYVADGEMAIFNIIASHTFGAVTDVNVMVTGTGYLIDGQDAEVSVRFDTNSLTKPLRIPTKANTVSGNNHGIITAKLLEGSTYVRSNTSAKNEATIAVVDVLPVISISEIADVNKSAGMFTFTLTSDRQALTNYPIKITTLSVDDTSSSGPQFYDSHSPSQIEISNASTNNAVEITVTLTTESQYQGWGGITVSLTNDPGYTVDSTANSRAVTIIDDSNSGVLVSFDTPSSVIEGENIEVNFTATSSISSDRTIMVDFQASNRTGTYLNYTNVAIEIIAKAGITTNKSVNIPTMEVANSSEGLIGLITTRGDGYHLTFSSVSRAVKVLAKEELPEVSITRITPAAIEEGETAVFTVSAIGTLPAQGLVVPVNTTQGEGENFLWDFNFVPATMATIPTSTNMVRYEVITQPDNTDEDNGTITVTIPEDPNSSDRREDATYFRGASNSVEFMVLDNDSPGTVLVGISNYDPAIDSNRSTVNEGELAIFYVSVADWLIQPPTSDSVINVHYKITQVGDILEPFTTPNNINITSLGYALIELPTKPDAIPEEGSVSVQIVADTEPTPTYSVRRGFRSTVNLIDTDNNEYPSVMISADSTSATEGSDQAMFTLNSVAGTDTSITSIDDVQVAISQVGNYLAPADITTREFDITSVGTGVPITVNIVNDLIDEAPGSIIARILPNTGAGKWSTGANDRASMTVYSDAADIPTLSITADSSNVSIVEGDDTSDNGELTFTVTRNGESELDITAKYTLEDSDPVSAVNGVDYVSTVSDVIIPSNQATGTITVEIIGDTIDEDFETFIVQLSSSSVNATVHPSQGSISETINDDDPEPTVSIADGSGVEGNVETDAKDVDLVVTLNPASGKQVIANYTVEAITAEQTDYILPDTLTVTFAPGQITQMISIPIVEDILDEPDETFRVTLTSATNASLPAEGATESATAIGTIESDDTPTLAIKSVTINEGIGTFNPEVTLSPSSSDIIMVDYTITAGVGGTGATSPADYSTTSNGTLTFATGEKLNNTISINVVDDEIKESDETFTITLSNPRSNGATIPVLYPAETTATVTVEDNEIPVIEIEHASLTFGGNDAVFLIKSNFLPDEPIEINFTPIVTGRNFLKTVNGKSSGDARNQTVPFRTEGSDFVGRLTIPTLDDTTHPPATGMINVRLNADSSGNDYILATGPHKLTLAQAAVIPKPVLEVDPTTHEVNEGQPVQFTIHFTRTVRTSATIDVNIRLTETGGNYLDTNQRNIMTIPVTRTALEGYQVKSFATKANDNIFGPNSEVTITILPGEDYKVSETDYSETVLVLDQSTPTGISVIAISEPLTEDEDNESEVLFQIKSNQRVTASDRIINIDVDDGDADFLSAGSRATSQVTIPQREFSVNLPLTIVGDDVFEIPGEIQVKIEDSGDGSYTPSTTNRIASIAVYDDDYPTSESADSVAIRAVKSVVSEANGDANGVAPFVIIPKEAKSTSRTVMVSVSDGTGDFLLGTTYDSNVEVVIPADAQSAPLNVNLENDNSFEEIGTITATIQSGIGYDIAQNPNHTASITVTSDDSDVPIITIRSNATTAGVTEGFSFDFEVMSDRNISGSPLQISFTPSYTGSATNPNVSVSGTTVSIPVGVDSATGTVTMDSEFDIGNSDNVDIAIAITENRANYTLGSPSSISVEVKDNDTYSPSRPRLSLASAEIGSVRADLSETADFTITATDQVTGTVMVSYRVSETGNFVADGDDMIALSTSEVTTNLPIPTSDSEGGTDDADSTLTVTLLDGTGYTLVDSTGHMATATITDDVPLPVVSLETTYTRVSDTDYVDYTLSATGITSDISVRLNVVTDGDNVVNSGNSELSGLRLTSAVPSRTGRIRFSTGNSGDSLVEIEIAMSASYTINQLKSQIAFRVDDGEFDPAVSIVGDGAVSEGTDAVFTVRTDEADASGRSRVLEVALAVSEGSTNFISGTPTLTATIPSDGTSVKYRVSTINDGSSGSSPGTITAAVLPGGYYKLAASNTSATVTVRDDAGIVLPEVSLETTYIRVSDTDYVDYTLSATGITSDITVRLNVVTDGDNVVNSGNSELSGLRLTSADSSRTGRIRFSTGNSGDSLVEIGITMSQTYTINQLKSQIAFRVDDGEFDPAVSIVGDGAVSEGADAVFTVSTNEADASGRSRPLVVALVVSEGNTSFISGTPTLTATIPSDETSVKYRVATTSDNSAGGNNGTITVTAQPGGYYKLATPNTPATVTVRDDAGQVSAISVAPATGKASIMEGEMVEFTFTSSPALVLATDVMISITEEGGDFISSSVESTPLVNLAAGATDTKTFATTEKADFNPNSKVTLTIMSGSGYTIGTASSSVTVLDKNTPTGISVIAISGDTTEDADNDSQVFFQIKSNEVNSTTDRTINISVDDGNANFLDSASRAKNNVTILQNEYSVNLPLTIVGDSDFEIHGEIQAKIEDSGDSSYTPSLTNRMASITVFDDDFPTGEGEDSVSIRAVKMTVSEADGEGNGIAPFLIIPKESKVTPRTILVAVSDGTGDFLLGTTYDNNVPVEIAANARSAPLNVNLENDRKYEVDGTITATIQNGSGYDVAAGMYNSASIMVTSDDPDVPIITIESSATNTGVTEGFSFDFTVTSDRMITNSPLEIDFNPTYSGTGTSPNLAIEGTTVSIPVGQNSATGTVTMDAGFDIGSSDNVTFSIAILEDYQNYEIGSPESITVKVKDNDTPSDALPRMSISSANYIADGETITFTVESSDMPNEAKDVKVLLSGQNFITDGRMLMETVNIGTTENSDTFTVMTKAGSVTGNEHGIITATILEGEGYVLSNTSAKNVASVAVVDNLPVISISNIADLNKSVGSFSFQLNSDIPVVAGHPIEITGLTITNASLDIPQYYTSHTPAVIAITTGSSVMVTANLTVLTTYQGWGRVNVALADGADYTPNSEANARSVVIMDDTTAPISVAMFTFDSIVEGYDLSVTLRATSTSSIEQTIMVNLQVANVLGTYLDYTNSLVEIVAAANDDTSKLVTIPTQNIANSTEGEISLVVIRADGYETTSTALTKVKVIARESLPVVSIENTGPAIIQEGEDAVFTISAVGTLAKDLPIPVTFDQGTSDFIMGTPTRIPVIDSTTNSVVYTIETAADTTQESDGTISVTIFEDPLIYIPHMDATYIRGSMASAEIMVEDNDAAVGSPVITISADSNSVYEGNDAVFTVSNAGSSEVNVHYSISQVGDFLVSTATEDNRNVPANGSTKLTFCNDARCNY